MAIDLSAKSFCIFGLRGTGKSTLLHTILNEFGKHGLYYDTLWESPDDAAYDSYRPKDRYSVAELENIVRSAVPANNTIKPHYRLIAIDEANRFCPPKPAPLPPVIADFNDQLRHYTMTGGYIARRPCQLNQDLTELADYIFIFRLTGKNDLSYLGKLVSGLDIAVSRLANHEFIMVKPDRSFVVCDPVTPDKQWLDRAAKLTT